MSVPKDPIEERDIQKVLDVLDDVRVIRKIADALAFTHVRIDHESVPTITTKERLKNESTPKKEEEPNG